MVMQQKRSTILAVGILVLFCILIARVIFLTFFNDKIKNYPLQTQTKRGMILDKRGIELALSIESATIGIDPNKIYDAEFTARYLSGYVQMPVEKIKETILSKQSYFLLKREIDKNAGNSIRNLSLPGVRVEKEYKRIYPQGTLASSVIGFTGLDDDKALAGLEKEYNLELLSSGGINKEIGNNLHLTLDSVIQYRLEKSLKKVFDKTKSKRAIGIFMDIYSGYILAMASFPNFNPNNYSSYPAFHHTNWAIRHTYEPGSTMKIFVALFLLNEGYISPRERFYCPGYIEYGTSIIRCTGKHGALTLNEIIQSSCNVGIIKAAQKLSDKKYYSYLKKFGFGEKTGFSIFETSGYLPPLEKWQMASPFFFSIGQGFSVTPIQLVASAAALVNGGILYQPMIVDRITTYEGDLVHQFLPKGKNIGIRPESKKVLLDAMVKVVQSGTGKKAYLQDITIAGKTGTGQKAIPGKGYREGLWSASFLGFFPAENPQVVGLILYDEPEGDIYTGGGLAAPVFAEVVEEVFPILETHTNPKEFTLKPIAPKKFLPPSQQIPNLKGLSKIEAIAVLNDYKLRYTMDGYGFVKEQSPPPGTPIQKETLVRIVLDK